MFTAAAVPSGTVVDVDPDLLNHSCEPTLARDEGGQSLVAFRDVEPGEQLPVDYATGSSDAEMVVRCHCGTYRCRQQVTGVTGDDWRIQQVQLRHVGHPAPVVQRQVDAST